MMMTGLTSSGGGRTRLIAGVSFLTQSPLLVTLLGNLHGNSSRKFVIFCGVTSGGKMSRGVSQVVLIPFLK